MVQGYTAQVRKILLAHGCTLVRKAKGDHEIWHCPRKKRPVAVDGKIMSRHMANVVLKQAGVDEKI